MDQPPLALAAQYGHIGVAQTLLTKPDIDINSADNYNETPIFKAALSECEDIIRALIMAGAKVRDEDIERQKLFEALEIKKFPPNIDKLLKECFLHSKKQKPGELTKASRAGTGPRTGSNYNPGEDDASADGAGGGGK